MFNLKMMGAAARLKDCSPRSRKWLRDETLRLAREEHGRQLTIHKTTSDDGARTLAGERAQALARAIDLLQVLEV